MNIERLKAQLIRHEGFVSHAYKDNTPDQYLTIGVGRLIDERMGGGITEEEAGYLLSNDIRKAEDQANDFTWYASLNDVRQNVIVELIFNLGLPRFKGFKKAIAAIQAQDFKTAAAELLDSRWAVQVGNRALRLAEMMRSGSWPQ